MVLLHQEILNCRELESALTEQGLDWTVMDAALQGCLRELLVGASEFVRP
jgi:hypothetical protein